MRLGRDLPCRRLDNGSVNTILRAVPGNEGLSRRPAVLADYRDKNNTG